MEAAGEGSGAGDLVSRHLGNWPADGEQSLKRVMADSLVQIEEKEEDYTWRAF